MSEDQVKLNQDNAIVDDETMDLTNVKQEVFVIPPSRNVKFFIAKIDRYEKNKDGTLRDWRFLNLQLAIEDGIPAVVKNETTGENEEIMKYKNKMMFQTVPYYANPDVYKKDWFKKKQHLVQFKMLASALGIDLNNLKVSDVVQLGDKAFVIADITQSDETVKNEQNEYVKTGDRINEIKNFRALPLEDTV